VRDSLVRRGLRFSQLRLLVGLQDSGQISAAAAQLAITQPAASRLLAELNELAGAQLYTRHARGIVLTEAGQQFAATARTILRELEETGQAITELVQGARGLVRIGAVTGPALEIVLPVIRELRVTYPEIAVEVMVDTSDKLSEALQAHRLDFYIGRMHEETDARAVAMRAIGPEPVDLIVRLEHPLTRKSDLRLEDCLIYDWIMQPPGGLQRRTVETYLLENGHRLPERILGTSSLLLTIALISETNAIAPVARSVGEFYAVGGGFGGRIQLLGISQDLMVSTYSLIRRADESLSPAASRAFVLIEARINRMAGAAGFAFGRDRPASPKAG
jgi:DNA-binding transcriptional LysR family regulator